MVEVARCEVGAAEQPDQPVAQILALKQDEDDEEQHDAGSGERRQQRADDGLVERPARRLGLVDLDRDRLVAGLLRRGADARRGRRAVGRAALSSLLQVGQDLARPFQHAAIRWCCRAATGSSPRAWRW